jgi:hypothetical protein
MDNPEGREGFIVQFVIEDPLLFKVVGITLMRVFAIPGLPVEPE